jgi:hypothetical protein
MTSQSLPLLGKQRGIYAFSSCYCYSRNFLMNTKAVLYSRFNGFGLLCFLRDIFTTHNTNTCQHCSRDTITISTAAAHTSAPRSVLRATEATNKQQWAQVRAKEPSVARDPSNTSLIFRTSFTLFTVGITCKFAIVTAINPFKPSGSYTYQLLTINCPAFCIYGFRMILRINSDDLL